MSEHSAEKDGHFHSWTRHQNVTSKGYVMPAYEACGCGAARSVPAHGCPSCTCVTPPRPDPTPGGKRVTIVPGGPSPTPPNRRPR